MNKKKEECIAKLNHLIETDPEIEKYKNEENYLLTLIDQLIFEIEKMKSIFYEMKNSIIAGYIESLFDRLMMLNNKFIELRKFYDKIAETTMIDDKTGLYNSRFMKIELKKLISASIRHHHNLSFVMIDFDDFKKINDNFGHLAGDYVLIETANIIKNNVREEDIACRFAGDEFCLILPFTNNIDAKYLINRLESKIKEHKYIYNNKEIPGVSISSGIASLTMSPNINYKDINEEIVNELMISLIQSADDLLYFSKKNKKNIYH